MHQAFFVTTTESVTAAMRKAIALFLVGGALTGCASLGVVSETQTGVETVPQAADWAETAGVQGVLPSNDWVGDFNDTTLSTLIEDALENNTSVRAAYAQYQAAQAGARIAGADRLPSVNGSLSASRTENGNDLLPDSTNLGAGINASWEVDLWGRIRDQVDASELQVSASAADLAGARLAIAGQVAQTWINLIEAYLLVDLSERDVETLTRALRLTTRRFEGGITGSSDVRLARTQLANSVALQASRKQIFAATGRSLEVLLRRYPSGELRSATDLPVLPNLNGVGVPSEILQRRPDLLAADRRLAAAGLNVDVAKKNLLPRITLTGGINSSSPSFDNLFDIDSVIANAAAGLTQPLFQGGRLRAGVKQQEAFLRAQLEQYTGQVLGAYLEVENALNGEIRLAEQEAALRTSLQEAFAAEERLELRYTEGLATILQLLDAQTRRITAESQLINARAERLANRIRLHLALGGGALGELSPDVLQGTSYGE